MLGRVEYNCAFEVVAIDPSIRSLGFAAFSGSGALLRVGTLKASAARITKKVSGHCADLEWASRALGFANAVAEELAVEYASHNVPVEVVIEIPEVYGTAKGIGSMHNGVIQKTYLEVGAIAYAAAHLPFVTGVWGVRPSAWKGQVSKSITKIRVVEWAKKCGCASSIVEYLAASETPTDAIDACGIGLYVLGRAVFEERGRLAAFKKPIVTLLDGVVPNNHFIKGRINAS